MEYRKLGKSSLNVSVIGFGAWGIGGIPFWQNQGDRKAQHAIIRAVERGINFFDTAPVYGFGHSEILLGKTLKSMRNQVLIASKCGLSWTSHAVGNIYRDSRRATILNEIDCSLKRLQTDWIDLYQIHWPDLKTPFEESIGTLLNLQKSGKIREFGVSNFSLSQLSECNGIAPVTALQNEYSLLNRSIERELLPYCLDQDIGILAYSPLGSGILTNKYDEQTKFTDWRGKKHFPQFHGEAFRKNIQKVKKLAQLEVVTGHSCAEMALNWIITKSGVVTALTGIYDPAHVITSCKALNWGLDMKTKARIERIFSG